MCGKEYEGCRTAKHINGQFRWQDVACSPEHGSIYLERIIASRTKKSEAEVGVSKSSKPVVIEPVVEDEENIVDVTPDELGEDDDFEENEE